MSEQQEKAELLAGGTDLLPACKLRNKQPTLLVSLGKIPSLKDIRFDESEGLRIGAMTSLNALRYDPLAIAHYPALIEAAAAVGTTQLQHMGTLGGNICLDTRCTYYNQSESWRQTRAVCLKMGGEVCHVVPKGNKCYAVFSGDMAPVLLALDARLKLASSAGERSLRLSEFYSGDGRKPLLIRPGEILEAVIVPPPAGKESSAYLKYRVRGAIDFPLAGVAVRLAATADGLCRDCSVAITAVSSAPVQVPEAADLLKGKSVTAELINKAAQETSRAAHPVANAFGATPSYRRKMIGILTRRTLTSLAQNLGMAVR
ncbi:putative 4-hydroxybenzoyl-CoA reductase, beta subunit [delta proteobacterium NaphS2]|nr:putative 4-hydroxybenzoyl-CoA reductase, beta subunit [delta proteobacterium NaphS2]